MLITNAYLFRTREANHASMFAPLNVLRKVCTGHNYYVPIKNITQQILGNMCKTSLEN